MTIDRTVGKSPKVRSKREAIVIIVQFGLYVCLWLFCGIVLYLAFGGWAW